jgi:hypothetical protein
MSARDIIALCQRNIRRFPDDCAAFVRSVANQCGVILTGNANDICAQIRSAPQRAWSGSDAAARAAEGYLVIAGLAAPGHGHVVIVVEGPVAEGCYPYAFWGQYQGLTVLGKTVNVGFTRGHGKLTYAFQRADCAKVSFAIYKPLELLLPRAGPSEGLLIHTFS